MDAVDDERQVGCVGDGVIMGDEPPLRSFVVVWGDDQDSVHTHGFGFLGQLDGVIRLVAARPGDDRNTAVYMVLDKADGFNVFLVV